MKQDLQTSKQLSDFLYFARTVTKENEQATEAVHKADESTQDILHQIELGSAKEQNRYATVLSSVRKNRRYYKDIVDITDPLVSYLQTKEAITVIRRLEQILGDVRKKESYVNNHRLYKPRIYTKLSIDLMEENKK